MLHLIAALALASCPPDSDATVSEVQAGPCLEAVLSDDVVTIATSCGPGTLQGATDGAPAVYLEESATLAYDLSGLGEGSDVALSYTFTPDDGSPPEDLVVLLAGPVTAASPCNDEGCDHSPGTPSLAAAMALALLLRRGRACST